MGWHPTVELFFVPLLQTARRVVRSVDRGTRLRFSDFGPLACLRSSHTQSPAFRASGSKSRKPSFKTLDFAAFARTMGSPSTPSNSGPDPPMPGLRKWFSSTKGCRPSWNARFYRISSVVPEDRFTSPKRFPFSIAFTNADRSSSGTPGEEHGSERARHQSRWSLRWQLRPTTSCSQQKPTPPRRQTSRQTIRSFTFLVAAAAGQTRSWPIARARAQAFGRQR